MPSCERENTGRPRGGGRVQKPWRSRSTRPFVSFAVMRSCRPLFSTLMTVLCSFTTGNLKESYKAKGLANGKGLSYNELLRLCLARALGDALHYVHAARERGGGIEGLAGGIEEAELGAGL